MTGQWIFAGVMALLGVLVIRAGLRIFRERSTRSLRFVAGQIKVDLVNDFPALLIGIGYVAFGVACLIPLGQMGLAALQNTASPNWSQLVTPPLTGFVGFFVFTLVIGLAASLLTRRD